MDFFHSILLEYCVSRLAEPTDAEPGIQKGSGFDPCVRKIPWRRVQQPTPIFWPGESHVQRSLMGYSPWNSPGQNTRVGSFSLLQGIFPTPGLNPGLRHCRQILYQLSHKGSQRILKWVAYPFSSRSFRSRNLTRVSCIAGGFFTN